MVVSRRRMAIDLIEVNEHVHRRLTLPKRLWGAPMETALDLLAKRLSRVPGFSPEALTPLATLATTRHRFRPTQTIIEAGSKFDGIYLVERGWSYFHIQLEDGKNQVVTFRLPGEFIGLGALVVPSAAWTVTAITNVEVIRFNTAALDSLLEDNAKLSRLFMRLALSQAVTMGEHLTDLGRRCAYDRVGRLILGLWQHLSAVGLAEDDGFDLPVSQHLLADTLGLTNVHLSRTLQRLRLDHLISVEQHPKKHVRILDKGAALRRFTLDGHHPNGRPV